MKSFGTRVRKAESQLRSNTPDSHSRLPATELP